LALGLAPVSELRPPASARLLVAMDCQKASEAVGAAAEAEAEAATGAVEAEAAEAEAVEAEAEAAAAGEPGAASSRSADATWCLCPSFATPNALSCACSACVEKRKTGPATRDPRPGMAPSTRDPRPRAPGRDSPLGLRWLVNLALPSASRGQAAWPHRACSQYSERARGSSALSSCSSASSWAERLSHTACGRPSGTSFGARQHPAARSAALASSAIASSAPTNIGRGGGRGRRIVSVGSAPARAKNPRTCEFSRSMVG
jgi:hypothetical protein